MRVLRWLILLTFVAYLILFAQVLLRAQPPRSLHIECKGSLQGVAKCVSVATKLRLLGDWSGVELCNEAGTCRQISDVFRGE